MKSGKRWEIILVTVMCAFIALLAVGCSVAAKKSYTVTFIDGDAVYCRVEVEMGKRLEFPADPTRDDVNYLFNGWYCDENAQKLWDNKTQRVTSNVILWSDFLYVSEVPGNIVMSDTAFSSTVTWLQRDIDEQTEFSAKLHKGSLVTQTDYAYSDEVALVESGLSGESGLTLTPYKNHNDIYTVSWTPAQIPQGGVYSVEIESDKGSATKDGLYFKGAGSEDNPYLLTDSRDLSAINTVDISADNYYKLQKSFNVKLLAQDISGKVFNGNLDGNGKTVTIDAGGCGLFSVLGENAVITDLSVDGSIADTAENCTGIIANVNNGLIEYCTVEAAIESSIGSVGVLEGDKNSIKGGAGGIAGVNNGTVSGCTYSGSARAKVGAGGIAVINNGDVNNCSYSGTLGAGNAIESGSSTSAMSYMGGIAAINYGTVTSCSATGRLLAQRSMTGGGANDNIGGIVAFNASEGSVTKCFTNSTRIHGNKNVGGIAGSNSGAISYCYVTANYRSNIQSHNYIGGSSNVGGVAGLSSVDATVTNCYVTANVYAYNGAAYKVASACENCVYLGGNLDERNFTVTTGNEQVSTAAKNLIYPGGNNVSVELTNEIKEEYKAKTYTLTLDENQFAVLNNGADGFYKSNTNLTFDGPSTVKDRKIKAVIVLEGQDDKEYVLGKADGNTATLSSPDKEDSYVIGYTLTKGSNKVAFAYKAVIGYNDLAIFDGENVLLYPVYAMGARPESYVLKVAIWNRYVHTETVNSLLEAYKSSAYYKAEYSVTAGVLGSSNNNNFKTDYDNGDFNVVFAYAAAAVGAWQNDSVEIYIYNVSSSEYGTLKVGLNGGDSVVTNFGQFLLTDTAKKIMCPDYVEVTLHSGEEQTQTELVLAGGSLILPTPDAEDGYAFAGWATKSDYVEGDTLFTKSVSYSALAQIAQNKAATLYAVFVDDSQVKVNTTLKVAVWSRYVQTETVNALIEAYKVSTYYKPEYQVISATLNSSNNNNFKTDYNNGDFNVAFAYAASAVDEWQDDRVEVYIYNVNSSAYGTLKVGLNGGDSVVTNFGLFLKTDTAKKIMNPAYISEAEAEPIEITLMNGSQYGDVLTVTNATEAQNTQIELPKITEIPDGYSVFLGWEVPGTQTVLEGTLEYAEIAKYAEGGKLTLNAKFAAEDVIVIGYWSYSSYVTTEVAATIKAEFEKYLTDGGCTNFRVVMREYTQSKVADLVDAIQSDGDVDYFIGGGKNITSTAGSASGNKLTTVGSAVQMTTRYIVQLTSTELAGKFTEYTATDGAAIKSI